MLHRIHRIIDVNLNRVSEGLRVLEDVARFMLEDKGISREIKCVRHFFSKLAKSDDQDLIESRDSNGDIGAEYDLTDLHKNLEAVVRANAKRVQEGIRVLEELVKLPEMNGFCSFSELRRQRYVMYTLEKRLIASMKIDTCQGAHLRASRDEKTSKRRKKTG